MLRIAVFCVMTPCSLGGGSKPCRRTHYMLLQYQTLLAHSGPRITLGLMAGPPVGTTIDTNVYLHQSTVDGSLSLTQSSLSNPRQSRM
jgi:hypothetical protein